MHRRSSAWRTIFWILLLVAAVGVAVPLFIPSYPPKEQGEELTFARYAQVQAGALMDNPIQHALAWQYQVKRVVTLDTSGTCGDKPYVARGRYSGVVVVRTWMGIPLATIAIGCATAALR